MGVCGRGTLLRKNPKNLHAKSQLSSFYSSRYLNFNWRDRHTDVASSASDPDHKHIYPDESRIPFYSMSNGYNYTFLTYFNYFITLSLIQLF